MAKKRKALLGVVPAESPLYRFHPLTRLIGLVVLAMMPLFINMPEALIAFILVIVGLFAWSGVDVRQLKMYLPVIVTVAFFMFLVSVLAPSRQPGDTAVQIGSVTVYYESLRWTLVSYLRVLGMLFATILYFSTNHETDTLVGLRSARLPFAASYVAGLSLRSAAMFLEDFHTIRQAEQARGLDAGSMSLKDRAKLYGMYLIPLFTISLRRADEISNALFARGYTISGRPPGGGKRPDFILTKYQIQNYDRIVSIILIALFLLVAYLQLAHNFFSVEQSPLNAYIYSVIQEGK